MNVKHTTIMLVQELRMIRNHKERLQPLILSMHNSHSRIMKKILIVDDELPILSGLSRALGELCGFQGDVRTVVNGREAIYESGHCFYDICFLDIMLPDMNGFVVKNEINLKSPETNIILMSGRYTAAELDGSEDVSDTFYIEKPFDFYAIKSMMRIALEGDYAFDTITRPPGRDSSRAGKRKFRRRPLNRMVGFYLMDSRYIEFKGCGIDISYAGIGLRTYYPLEQGQVVYFKKGVSRTTGIVAWSSRDEDNNCIAGVRFV